MNKTLVAALLFVSFPALAGEPSVTDAQASQSSGTWRFDVTVAHADEGWDHYANAWQIAAPDGTVLGTRELLHPHVSEQPFTRSLGNVAIPADVDQVQIRARDSVHGWGQPYILTLPDS
jgi:hypothetical protein